MIKRLLNYMFAYANKVISPDLVKSEDYRKYVAILIASIIAWLIHFSLIFVFLLTDHSILSMINIASVALWSMVLKDNYQGEHSRATLIACFEIFFHCLIVISNIGLSFGFQFYLWSAACLISVNPKMNSAVSGFVAFLLLLMFGVSNLLFAGIEYTGKLYDFHQYIFLFNAVLSGLPIVYSILHIRNINEKQQFELSQQATHDELTGLYNRYYLRDFLMRWQERWGSLNSQCYIALGDIDHFKKINDKYGHDNGDSVLASIANVMKQEIREEDVVCRWGGEEFILVFFNVDKAQALEALERVHVCVSNAKILEKERVTMSFGLTCLSANEPLDDSIERADRLMYKAKEGGRNLIIPDS